MCGRPAVGGRVKGSRDGQSRVSEHQSVSPPVGRGPGGSADEDLLPWKAAGPDKDAGRNRERGKRRGGRCDTEIGDTREAAARAVRATDVLRPHKQPQRRGDPVPLSVPLFSPACEPPEPTAILVQGTVPPVSSSFVSVFCLLPYLGPHYHGRASIVIASKAFVPAHDASAPQLPVVFSRGPRLQRY